MPLREIESSDVTNLKKDAPHTIFTYVLPIKALVGHKEFLPQGVLGGAQSSGKAILGLWLYRYTPFLEPNDVSAECEEISWPCSHWLEAQQGSIPGKPRAKHVLRTCYLCFLAQGYNTGVQCQWMSAALVFAE